MTAARSARPTPASSAIQTIRTAATIRFAPLVCTPNGATVHRSSGSTTDTKMGVAHPPTFMEVVSGTVVGGYAITVRNSTIRLKFFCDIWSSPSI